MPKMPIANLAFFALLLFWASFEVKSGGSLDVYNRLIYVVIFFEMNLLDVRFFMASIHIIYKKSRVFFRFAKGSFM